MADGGGGSDDDGRDQNGQNRPAKDRAPLEGEKEADGTKGEGCNLAKRQGEVRSNETQAVFDGLYREAIEMAASFPHYFHEQPFSGEAQR
jgi:hypothetical protein